MSDTRMLIVAAYQDVDVAEAEFRALAAKVGGKELTSDGMILVGKDADGNPRVADTGNHLGRRGAGWGGGVGVLVGLFAPWSGSSWDTGPGQALRTRCPTP